MRVVAKQSATERLVTFLKDKRSFLIKADIDVDHYLTRIEQSGALIAMSELLQQADAEDLHLPPGYWRFIQRLKQELEEQE
jgi:hypothetical protein